MRKSEFFCDGCAVEITGKHLTNVGNVAYIALPPTKKTKKWTLEGEKLYSKPYDLHWCNGMCLGRWVNEKMNEKC